MFQKNHKPPAAAHARTKEGRKSVAEAADDVQSEPELPSMSRRVRDGRDADPDSALQRRVEQLMSILAENAPDVLTRAQLKRLPVPAPAAKHAALSKGAGPFLSLESILANPSPGQYRRQTQRDVPVGATGGAKMPSNIPHLAKSPPPIRNSNLLKPAPQAASRLPRLQQHARAPRVAAQVDDYPGMPTDPFRAPIDQSEEAHWPDPSVTAPLSPHSRVIMLASGIPVSVTNAQYQENSSHSKRPSRGVPSHTVKVPAKR
jgi:hypothetical protein